MKKLISILIIGIMVFGTGAVAFATGTDQTNMNQKNRPAAIEKMKQVKPGAGMEREHKVTPAAIKAHFTEAQLLELNNLRIKIKAEQITLFNLKKEILKNVQIIKHTLKTSDASITMDNINSMKDIYAKLEIDRKAINVNVHPGMMKDQAKLMKDVRGHKDFAVIKAAMNKILDEQNARFKELTKINTILTAYIQTLK